MTLDAIRRKIDSRDDQPATWSSGLTLNDARTLVAIADAAECLLRAERPFDKALSWAALEAMIKPSETKAAAPIPGVVSALRMPEVGFEWLVLKTQAGSSSSS